MAEVTTTLDSLVRRINETMARLIERDEEVVARVSGYSFEGGGKRLRPLLFCLITEALGAELTDERLETAVSFELLHMATLLHDDIVDLAVLRRGREAAHLVFGVPETILAGDYLLAKASLLGSRTGNIECVKIMSKVVGALSLGELVQLGARRQVELSEEEYFKIIYRKTAVLMEGTARTAAVLAGSQGLELEAAVTYGRQFGLAFQIMDDILDYQGDQTTFGKPVGHDLDEGKITLPFIRAREALNDERRGRLCELAGHEHLTAQDHEEIKELVNRGGGVISARIKADELAHEALSVLDHLPPTPARDHLKTLARDSTARRN